MNSRFICVNFHYQPGSFQSTVKGNAQGLTSGSSVGEMHIESPNKSLHNSWTHVCIKHQVLYMYIYIKSYTKFIINVINTSALCKYTKYSKTAVSLPQLCKSPVNYNYTFPVYWPRQHERKERDRGGKTLFFFRCNKSFLDNNVPLSILLGGYFSESSSSGFYSGLISQWRVSRRRRKHGWRVPFDAPRPGFDVTFPSGHPF